MSLSGGWAKAVAWRKHIVMGKDGGSFGLLFVARGADIDELLKPGPQGDPMFEWT